MADQEKVVDMAEVEVLEVVSQDAAAMGLADDWALLGDRRLVHLAEWKVVIA